MRFSSVSSRQHLATTYNEFAQLLGTISGNASFACGKMWESNIVQNQGVLANTCLKDPEDMNLECFRGGGSKVFYLTFIYSFLLLDSIIFAYS